MQGWFWQNWSEASCLIEKSNFPFVQEFIKRRPYTNNTRTWTSSGYQGDVQVTTFDGVNIVYNGAMEMLMAKGNSSEDGSGFAMTALLQVRCTLYM